MGNRKPRLPDGWMGKKGRRFLREMASRSSMIVEVGVWKGRSTVVMAGAMPVGATLFAVDSWEGVPHDPGQAHLYPDPEGARRDFFRNLAPYIGGGSVVPVRMDSVEAAHHLGKTYGPVFDFVFIDADHSYEGCLADIRAYLPLLRPGGMLAGHDYHWPAVKRAVDEVLGEANRLELGSKSIWRCLIPG